MSQPYLVVHCSDRVRPKAKHGSIASTFQPMVIQGSRNANREENPWSFSFQFIETGPANLLQEYLSLLVGMVILFALRGGLTMKCRHRNRQ
jgi:hypothetical protein